MLAEIFVAGDESRGLAPMALPRCPMTISSVFILLVLMGLYSVTYYYIIRRWSTNAMGIKMRRLRPYIHSGLRQPLIIYGLKSAH